MLHRIRLPFLAATLCAAVAGAQQTPPGDSARPERPPAPPTRFYDSPEPLTVTFTANLNRLRQDKDTNPKWGWARITYADGAGTTVNVPARARPRGIWRRNNCKFPPLRIDFARDSVKGTVFEGMNRPKLVNYCIDDGRADEYILQEYQIYRIYQLLTPMSHRARLLRMAYADSARGRVQTTHWAILVEEPNALADRLGGKMLETEGARADDLDPFNNALVGVFQYMIGNTDWSTAGLHNMELIQREMTIYGIPYDFDYAGAVHTFYAQPPPILPIRSVRQRLYRGLCAPAEEVDKAIALLKERKDAIYALYSDADPVGKLMKDVTVKRTLDFFDDFYKIVADPRKVKKDIVDACLKDS